MRRLLGLILLTVLLQYTGFGSTVHLDRLAVAARRVSAPAAGLEPLPPDVRIELVMSKVRNPVAMAFALDGRWFFTERTTGDVRWAVGNVDRGQLLHVPTIQTASPSEQGLLGIALDPGFASNGYLYVYYTSAEDFAVTQTYDNRVVRFTLDHGPDVSPTLMLKVPLQGNAIHNGGNLHFGPDGKLYVSIGDYASSSNGQDLNTLPAKIHRFDPTAPLSAPPDNPFFTNPSVLAKSIYAYGFRNPFDFDFDPVSGALFAGENGVACDDEVNRVLPGYNYGWRANYPTCDDFSTGGPDPAYNTVPPLAAWPYSVAPTGVTFYRGDSIPEWKNDLFVCHWKTGELHHFKLNAARDAIVSDTIIAGAACNLDIETGTDGALYFLRNDESEPAKEYRDIYRITRDATVYASTLWPSSPSPAAGSALTYTMRLVQYGTLTTTYSITSSLPASTTLAAGSPQATSGAISGSGAGILWTGSITPNTALTATYRLTVNSQLTAPTLLSNTMIISTDLLSPTQRTAFIIANGQAVYLPLVLR